MVEVDLLGIGAGKKAYHICVYTCKTLLSSQVVGKATG